jgi:hypothetical protein
MAIKIDLLPGYVGLRRVFRNLLLGAAVLIGSVAAVLFLVYYKNQQELTAIATSLENVQSNANATKAAEGATATATSEAAPYEAVVKFMVAAGQTGPERAALLDLVSRQIYGGAVVSAIDLSDGQTARLNATVGTPEDYAQLLLELRRGSATNGGSVFAADPRTNQVVPSGIPGFPAAPFRIPEPGAEPELIRFPLPVSITATLLNKVVLPGEPTGAAAAPAVDPNADPNAMPPG